MPGLNPERLVRLMKEAVARCELDLTGLTVLTEAASGAYVVTPLLAALAGARHVYAVARDSRFGTAREVADNTSAFARKMNIEDRITFIPAASPEIVSQVDILTNSGHVRPITAAMISCLKPGAVVPLMYENWEFRPADLDLEACLARGIKVGGTNERHPAVGVFEYLGVMTMKLLLEAGVAVHGSRVLLLCDNDFGPYIEATLRAANAQVQASSRLPERFDAFDAIVIAATPQPAPALSGDEMERIARQSPGAIAVQFFGDLDRSALAALHIAVWPEKEPEKGHMGILPSAVGPEPIVRLQAGGLKAAEDLHRGSYGAGGAGLDFVQPFTGLSA